MAIEKYLALDGTAVAEGMSTIHNETASILKYNNENSLATGK